MLHQQLLLILESFILQNIVQKYCLLVGVILTLSYLHFDNQIHVSIFIYFVASVLYSSISLLLPLFAILIINQDWKFYINFLNVEVKPWRLFLFACSVPNLICAAVLQFVLLESPKYTFSRGNEAETLMILRKIFRMNTGKSILEYSVSEIKKNEEYGATLTMHKGFITTFWSQSVPLFQGKYLRHILTACFLQFSMCLVCNGFWVFLPEIINHINLFIDSNPNGSATACEVYNMYSQESNSTHPICVEKLEVGTFIYVFEIVGSYVIFYTLISTLINRLGKLIILELVLLIPGAATIGIMFLPQPEISSYLYIIMILVGLGLVIVNASTIEIFPTKMRFVELYKFEFCVIIITFKISRAMAVCVSMMFGRVGSVVGSVIIGIVINSHCKYTFLMPVILLFTSAVLAFTIPNIGKRIK